MKDWMTKFCGFKVYVSTHCEGPEWQFPKERFFEWEAKDEWFCRKYGIGRLQPKCYQIGSDAFVMHPLIYRELVRQASVTIPPVRLSNVIALNTF